MSHAIELKIHHTGRGITNELFFKCAKIICEDLNWQERSKPFNPVGISMSKSGMAQINSFATKNDRESDESTPQPGLVKNVCRQWVVHEDEGLAHRLQEDEFRNHFGRNKEHHRTIQTDIKVAKKSHSEEVDEIQRQQLLRARKLKEMEDQDYAVAERLQKLLVEEQNEHTHRRRHQDQMLAFELQEEERLNKTTLPEQRNLHHHVPCCSRFDFADRSENLGGVESDFLVTSSNEVAKYKFEAPVRPPRKHAGSSRSELDRRLQEQQDEALARALQNQEQDSAYVDIDHRLALESQDAEYAKILEEKERERYRRAKEKQKAKQEANTLPVTSPGFDNPVSANAASRSMSLPLANQIYSETATNLSKTAIVSSPSEADSRRYRNNQQNSPANNMSSIEPTYGRLHGRDNSDYNAIQVPTLDGIFTSNSERISQEAVSASAYEVANGRSRQLSQNKSKNISRTMQQNVLDGGVSKQFKDK
ncbi:coiled-coil domain-containing protein 50-like isoform X2 [Paramacrobiotus metropolitanus]|uniref:coiled-coil domain-containing protein 50-like isoform X2 n=1 Tax=Paramacrobiotus metropolitanus TaxID=2943436 RepID=UPI002445DB98|nr:coiled-coil domain-containing protein 50-like isoform X2 [Paramacrobiotus metropolitanus]